MADTPVSYDQNSPVMGPTAPPGGLPTPGTGASSLISPFLNMGAGILNYGTQSNALNTATNAMNQGYTAARGGINTALTQSQSAFAPYQASGVNALNQMNAPGGVQLAPGYQFAQQAGQEAINSQAASRGQFFSPGTMQALSQFSSENANQFYQQAWNNLFSQSQQGLGATQQQTQQQNTLAGMLANLYTGQGTQQASSAMAGGNLQSSLISGIASAAPAAIASLF